jgi:hypothetical protein
MTMNDAYTRLLEAWLDQWSARLDESQARIDAMAASMSTLDDVEARSQCGAHLLLLQQKIEHARARLDEGRSKVEALRQSGDATQGGTDSAWDLFKAEAELAWDDLKNAMDQNSAASVAPDPREGSVQPKLKHKPE